MEEDEEEGALWGLVRPQVVRDTRVYGCRQLCLLTVIATECHHVMFHTWRCVIASCKRESQCPVLFLNFRFGNVRHCANKRLDVDGVYHTRPC